VSLAGVSVTERTKAYCGELLELAMGATASRGGAIFLVNSPGHVELVVSYKRKRAHELKKMERAAVHGLSDRRASIVEVASPKESDRGAQGSGAFLVVPASLEDAVVAIVVLAGMESPERSLEECSLRLEPVLFPIALSVEHLRVQGALEVRGKEISALRQQLDAYAVDFRSTYLAERARSEELAAALGALEQTYRATVNGLAVAVEAKDECTGGHLVRVCRYGMMLTTLVAPEHANDLQFEYGFLLHDIGKLTVPDVVLTKPGPLTESEWDLIREHPESGRSILEDIAFLSGAREIVHAHHERWDGKGYPRGLAGDEIPLGAKIFPLCDAFDAMTSERPYRAAFSVEHARTEIRTASGTQFWSEAVEAFLSLPVADLEAVRRLPSKVAV
jgi:ribonuclease P protein subunit RPR2